mgnify:CR=1 FL=1
MNRPDESPKNSIIIYTTEDGLTKIDATFDGDTVWLSIDQMAELFQRDRSVIGKHVRNIFKEGELQKELVWAKFAYTAADGKVYDVDYYNLDVIISVGYRVKSKRGTQFRIWATGILKEYMRKGFALDDERLKYITEACDEVISGKLVTTLYMAVLSLLLSMPIGILLGTVTAVKRGQWADTIITLFSNLLIAIPQFVTAILFLYYISMKWKLLPPQGFTWPWVDFHKHIQQLIMPLTCLTLCGIAGFCRQTRSSVLEVLGQDYVRTARAKGLKETRILWKHVMNNGLIPILTMIGGRLASLIGGSIFVENVFNIPGMGNLMVKAVNTMDIPVIQALVLITAAVISVAYIITDLLYVAVDPRISLS